MVKRKKEQEASSIVLGLRVLKTKDFVTCSRTELLEAMLYWKRQNGMGGSQKYIMSLIADIVELRGMEMFTDMELHPDTNLDWEIAQYDHATDAYVPKPGGYDCEYMGAFNVSGRRKLLFLYWLGKRPEPEKVAKKVKEIGATTLVV